MITKTFRVKPSTFRKLDDPFENGKSRKYVFYAKVDDVPEGIPMATNPREQRLTSSVAKAIEESLCSNDGYFHLKNRGIVLSASKVKFDNKKEEVTLEFDDDFLHGDIDGGHTYKIVCNHQNENLDQYVQFEVMTGVEDIIEDLARARNTSVQVSEVSMAELEGKFDPIKEGIEGMPFYKRIAFKQFQSARDSDTGKNLKMIDPREVVAIISMFDSDRYGPKDHPIQAYSSKKKILEEYLKNPEHYRKFINIDLDIFDLYDTIETEFAVAYNAAGGRYGRKKYSLYKEDDNRKPIVIGKSKFMGKDLYYKIPDGLLYPVVAAFRTLVVVDVRTGKYGWSHNPIEVWENCKQDLTSKVVGFATDIGDNPNAVGKNRNLWDLAYMTVTLQK